MNIDIKIGKDFNLTHNLNNSSPVMHTALKIHQQQQPTTNLTSSVNCKMIIHPTIDDIKKNTNCIFKLTAQIYIPRKKYKKKIAKRNKKY